MPKSRRASRSPRRTAPRRKTPVKLKDGTKFTAQKVVPAKSAKEVKHRVRHLPPAMQKRALMWFENGGPRK